MAKLDIDFILLDESKVRYGFRALMSGGDLEGFMSNPVMLLQHNRPKEHAGKDDIMLPIGSWYDIRLVGSQLLAKPDFDDDDELAQRVQKKVEKKYLNGVSVWIDPIAVSDDPSVMLPGQTLPTFTKWEILEASIVDIPNCKNALAIRNSAGNRITLSGATDQDIILYLKTLTTNTYMDKKLLCAKLGLTEDATDAQIGEKLAALNLNGAQLGAVSTENESLKLEVVRLKSEAEGLKLEAEEKKISDLVDGAVTALKLLAGEKEKWVKMAKADFETTESILLAMKPHTTLESQLAAGGEGGEGNKLELAELVKLSGKELYMTGKLEQLKTLSIEAFKPKYKEAFGVEYKG